ncbi:hypothetical protein COCMIDRAFT_104777 [Bipolaris oryzae ATCC 44560]|uniref:Uncharacterized protein n=1 Tax=Bipolaris oryzae ATCC 44560 TaxID=930090 RepID=W6Z2R0_COCMI|nr:uncharacterized protein COCMIDRAFT_104777 [Bipolaris oryzae ATCC 44560]EUC41939.1 hypothetical protein COCMIDRAFT_104777 [Bipolaris oryzae ATCC 44560]
MRFNAVIASAILAATVSSAALPVPAEAAEKREAEPQLPTWPRPYGLPYGMAAEKREAEAEPQVPTWDRPYGFPHGMAAEKREAEAEPQLPTWPRPYGLPYGMAAEKRQPEALEE